MQMIDLPELLYERLNIFGYKLKLERRFVQEKCTAQSQYQAFVTYSDYHLVLIVFVSFSKYLLPMFLQALHTDGYELL